MSAVVTKEEAREIAQAHLAEHPMEHRREDDLLIRDDLTQSHDFGWVFLYHCRGWIETRDDRFLIAGNAPLIVEASTGRLFTTGTARSLDYYILNFQQTGDPQRESSWAVRISSWRAGCLTVSAIRYLREHFAMTLPVAKATIERCLDGEQIDLPVPTEEGAVQTAASLTALGFETHAIRQ